MADHSNRNRDLTAQDLGVIQKLIANDSIAIRKWPIIVDYIVERASDIEGIKQLYTERKYLAAINETLTLWNGSGKDLLKELRDQGANLLAGNIENLECWKRWKSGGEMCPNSDAPAHAPVPAVVGSRDLETFLKAKADDVKYDSANLKLTASTIHNVLAAAHKDLVKRCAVAGSVGKGTAIKGYPDLDLVVFVAAHPPFADIIESFRKTLTNAVEFKSVQIQYHEETDEYTFTVFTAHDEVKVEKVTRYSLQFKYNGYEVDLLPAAYFADTVDSQLEKTLVRMKELYDRKSAPYMYNTSLCEATVRFVDQRADCRSLIMLVKYWARAREPKVKKFPGKSYMLELISIHVRQTLGSRDVSLAIAFKECMKLLLDFDQLQIILNENPYVIPENIKKEKPLIMDPVNPFNNLLGRKSDAIEAGIRRIEKLARNTLTKIESMTEQGDGNWESLFD